jgi:hypothetical protein
MTDQRKKVWILGAGFSKSLGGPMLVDAGQGTQSLLERRRVLRFP